MTSKAGQAFSSYQEIVVALKWALQTIDRVSKTYGIEHTSNDASKTNWDKLYEAKQALAQAEAHAQEPT